MYPTVRQAFMGFTDQFEGGQRIDYMFCDSLGRVGSAYGLDFDINAGGPSTDIAVARREGLPKAIALKWMDRATGRIATSVEVTAEWERVKALGNPGAKYAAGWYLKPTSLRLDSGSMQARVVALLNANEATLKRNPAFAAIDTWPADAQLALFGLAWNGAGHLLGGGHGTLADPIAFRQACGQGDFNAAAATCGMIAATTNASIQRRSEVQKKLFLNAAIVAATKPPNQYSVSVLYWPRIL